jgi:hypothetical protein
VAAQQMKPRWQGWLFYMLILAAIIALAFSFFSSASEKPQKVDFYTFVAQVKQGWKYHHWLEGQ